MKREKHRWILIFPVLVMLGLIFSVIFFLSKSILQFTGLGMPDILIQLINFYVSMVIYLIFMRIVFAVFNPHREKFFNSLIYVLEKIAGGDFQARVDSKMEKHGPFGSLAKSINSMADELSRMEEMRQNFISNVSHEIQSPLTSIIGFTRILQTDRLESVERQHYLSIIESESGRLSRLSDSLLKLAAFDAKTIIYNPGEYQLDNQIRECVLSMEPQWVAKKINIELQLVEILITADEDMLSQVWLNLLQNSIKFTPKNGNVKIELNQTSDKVVFRITDNGIGIAAEEQDKIFERFYKSDKSRTTISKGNGLGLSIVKEIIDLHAGTIKLQSEVRKGTAITVELNAKKNKKISVI